MTSHVYPMHAHEAWTLLIVDDGMIRYDLHGREHGAMGRLVTLLPPHVPHNGRAATSAGFGKRVVYLGKHRVPDTPMAGASVADELRGLIDSRFRESMTLRDAADALHAHPAHLVRAFSRAFGMSPHQYLTSRRIDLARRLLLDGVPPARAAAEAGFYDQPHLNRHFRHISAQPRPVCPERAALT